MTGLSPHWLFTGWQEYAWPVLALIAIVGLAFAVWVRNDWKQF